MNEVVMFKNLIYSKNCVYEIDEFMNLCGYSFGDTNINNGYGCNHPEQEMIEFDENNLNQGKCYSWSCPLCNPVKSKKFYEGVRPYESKIKSEEI